MSLRLTFYSMRTNPLEESPSLGLNRPCRGDPRYWVTLQQLVRPFVLIEPE